jgi:ubiquinone/menaquinone biosynthesis C-methylase UbiE
MLPDLHTRDSRLELLDAPELDPGELRRNLREMARLNRLPGGVHASRDAIVRHLDGGGASVLDVGTGSGDLVEELARNRNGSALRIVASDVRAEILEVARCRLRSLADVEFMLADARDIPLPSDSVEVAHASLVLHHLDPPGVVDALREMRRVARRAVVVNDLRRSRLALALVTLTVLGLTRSRYTHHDGPLSVRRAYTLGELDEMAAAAGLRATWRSPAFLPRVVTVYQ